MMDFRIFKIILPFLSACGNNLTYGKNVDNIKEWPSLAVAFNEVSNVHCTATIGTYQSSGKPPNANFIEKKTRTNLLKFSHF